MDAHWLSIGYSGCLQVIKCPRLGYLLSLILVAFTAREWVFELRIDSVPVRKATTARACVNHHGRVRDEAGQVFERCRIG